MFFLHHAHSSFAEASIAGSLHSVGVLAYKTGREETMNLKLILHEILEDYALPIHGDHGVAHWARVLENGLKLAEATGANVTKSSRCLQFSMIHVALTNALTMIMACGVLISLLNFEVASLILMTINSNCCIVPVKGIRMNGLTLTSRYRLAGTRIDLILDVLGSLRIPVNSVPKWQKPKR
jgi:hypothetical protein